MDATEKTIALFTTRMRQMILRFQDMKTENRRLAGLVKEREAKIAQLEAQLT